MPRPRLPEGSSILVLTEDWAGSAPYIRYYPDLPCLDSSFDWSTLRSRLLDAADAGDIGDCATQAKFKVTRCKVGPGPAQRSKAK